MNNLRFEILTQKNLEQTQTFIINECKKNYEMRIDPSGYARMRTSIQNVYDSENGVIFVAMDGDRVVGSISVSAYDHRITCLSHHYQSGMIAEIGRCYVSNAYRRHGIASMLFYLAKKFARGQRYDALYLHTHYFLSGGVPFWQNMGFQTVLDEGGIWEMVHMEYRLNVSAYITVEGPHERVSYQNKRSIDFPIHR